MQRKRKYSALSRQHKIKILKTCEREPPNQSFAIFFFIFHMKLANASDKGANRAWVNVRLMGPLSAQRRPISELSERKKENEQRESGIQKYTTWIKRFEPINFHD